MKVGILTIFAVPNYGAMLQAHGLSSYLRGAGHDAEVVDYRQPDLERYFRFKWKFPPAVNHWRRLRNGQKFVAETISTGPVTTRSLEEFQRQVDQYDAYEPALLLLYLYRLVELLLRNHMIVNQQFTQ
jgi:hypothetical protein